jgi:hypothetical protein
MSMQDEVPVLRRVGEVEVMATDKRSTRWPKPRASTRARPPSAPWVLVDEYRIHRLREEPPVTHPVYAEILHAVGYPEVVYAWAVERLA